MHPLTTGEREAVQLFLERVRSDLRRVDISATVFGSRARGEGDPESDLDILLVIEQDDLPIRRRIFDLAYEVFLATDVLISPLVVSRGGLVELRERGRHLIQDIERDGVLIA